MHVAETKLEPVFARHASQEAESVDTPPFVTRGLWQSAPVRRTVWARLRDLSNAWARTETDEARAALIERFAARLDVALVQDALDRPAVPEEMVGLLEHALFARLAEFDPTAAIALLEKTLPAGSRRDELQLGIALQWAEADLPSAIAWVAQWPEAAVQTRAVDELRALFAAANPDDMQDLGAIALAFAQTLPEGRDALVVTLAAQWAQTEPQAAAK